MSKSNPGGILRANCTIHLEVSYFDDVEKGKLRQYPTAQAIEAAVDGGVEVNAAQFLTYFLFYRKRDRAIGFRDYHEISSQLSSAVSELESWVRYEDGSLVARAQMAPQERGITEHLGEAGSLSVIGALHGLHEADWQKIPERGLPRGTSVFDYSRACETASDGKHIVQLEAKGSAVDDTSVADSRVKKQKRRIDKKKAAIRSAEQDGDYPFPAGLRYGVICSVGIKGRLRCWLVDPPAVGDRDATQHRLLSRLGFISRWISLFNGRSQFAASLATRLRALEGLDDPFMLDRVPLTRPNGEPFHIPSDSIFERSQGMFTRMCRASDGPAVGTLLRLKCGRLFFVGVQRELYAMAATQDFSAISKYQNPGGSVSKTVNCVLPRGRARTMDLLGLDELQESTSPYIRFRANGLLHYGQGASVFGLVEPVQKLGNR